jgi:predicted membrane channel-forming protein YqfA (hemolysin III family)
MVIFKGQIHMLTKTDIEKYFIAEKQESLIFLVIGLIAIVVALILYFVIKTPVSRGSVFPLLILGLIQSVAGYSVYIKSDDQRISQVYAYDMNPNQLKMVELKRMQKVKANFRIYRFIEIGAIIVGIILTIAFCTKIPRSFWLGFGIALTLMAVELFVADFIAEKRAFQYTALLEQFIQKTKL